MSDEEQPGSAQPTDAPEPEEPQSEDTEWTDFGYGFATLMASLLFFFAPWYFFADPFPKSLVLIAALALYLAGLIVAMFAIHFFNAGFQQTPELRQIFPSLAAGKDAWDAAFGTVIFLVIILVIQLLIVGFNLHGIAAVVAKLIIYVMAVLGITQAALTFDGFVIRPLRETAAKGPQEFEPLIKRVRQVGVIIGFIVALIAGIATIIDVF